MATKQTKETKIEYSHILNKSVLELNEGQLDGLPRNPRFIKDEKFAKLKLSLEQSPEFLKARPLLVYPLDNGHYIICGGNMRFLAGNEVGITDYPCYIFPKNTPTSKLKEYLIKDNVAYGSTDWDALANDDWNVDDLEDWGVNVDFLKGDEDDFKLGDLEDLEEGGFQKELRETTQTFEMSFVFPLEKKEEIEKYIKENGKEGIVQMIIQMTCNPAGTQSQEELVQVTENADGSKEYETLEEVEE